MGSRSDDLGPGCLPGLSGWLGAAYRRDVDPRPTGPDGLPAGWAEDAAEFIRQRAEEITAQTQAAAERASRPSQPPAPSPPLVTRRDYVLKDDEARFLDRDAAGRPNLHLRDDGDRLHLWSPVDGGALVNPRGHGIRRHLGLVTSTPRGTDHYPYSYSAADLRRGRLVKLVREPNNKYDPNAVAMQAIDGVSPFGYVARGHAKPLSKRMLAGEKVIGVSLRGPGARDNSETSQILIGELFDILHLLRLAPEHTLGRVWPYGLVASEAAP